MAAVYQRQLFKNVPELLPERAVIYTQDGFIGGDEKNVERSNSKDALLTLGLYGYGLLLRNGSERIWWSATDYTDFIVDNVNHLEL